MKNLRRLSEDASFVLSVCTGSFLPDAGSRREKGYLNKELSTGSFPHPIKSIG
ncbi:MAG: hypothetical protein ACLUIQ_08390 [Dialister invisus]